jgi:cardiolipin hydrolase
MHAIHDFEALLRDLNVTGELSRTDKKRVRRFLKEMCPEPDQLAALRHALVAVAEARLADHDARTVLHWSHDLGKLLLPNVPTGLPEAECHFSPSESGRTRLCELIGSARESIDLCIYLLADDEMARALVAARRDHGVVVRLILDDEQLKQRGSDHEALAAAGIAYRTDSCAQYMHHKFGIYDRTWLSTGSANWTRAAAEANFENMIMTNDPRLVGPYVCEFERLWKNFE